MAYRYYLYNTLGDCVDQTEIDEQNEQLAREIFEDGGNTPIPEKYTIDFEQVEEED